jgi:hypothetical protein
MHFLGKVLVLLFVVSTGAVLQEIELFTGPNQTGNSITFREKIPDLKIWKFFLADVKSYCVVGFWYFYYEVNYRFSKPFTGRGDGFENLVCGNYSDFESFNSVRYLGPQDTRAKAIAIYEGIPTAWGGQEVVVTGKAQTNFPMKQIEGIIVYGNSNWTVFNEDNFQGNSSGVSSGGKLFLSIGLNYTFPVRSVLLDD